MKNLFLGVALLFIVLHSCDSDDFTGYSSLIATNPVISAPLSVIAEEGVTFRLNIALSEPQIADMFVDFRIDEVLSTATLDDDYSLITSSPIRIPAHSTFFTIEFETFLDFAPEGMESIAFIINEERQANGPVNSETLTAYIDDTNNGGCDLEVLLGWDALYDVVVEVTGTAAYGGPFDLITGADIVDGAQQLNGCAFADFDFLTVDDEFVFFYGSFSPQTANCPEVVVYPAEGIITNGTATTDTFFIFSELYLNWGDSEFTSDPEPLPVIAQFTKQNTVIETWTQDDANAYQTNTPGDFGSFANIQPILEIRKNGCTWTILEGTSIVFTARQREALREINNGTRQLKWYEQE